MLILVRLCKGLNSNPWFVITHNCLLTKISHAWFVQLLNFLLLSLSKTSVGLFHQESRGNSCFVTILPPKCLKLEQVENKVVTELSNETLKMPC